MSGKVLTVIGLSFDLLGAFVIGWGVILTKDEAEKLAGTYYGKNTFLERSLLGQRNKTLVGLVLLVLGAGFQIAGALSPQTT